MYSGQKYLSHPAIDRQKQSIVECQVGCPIRKFRDQRVLSPPPDLSQSATSFIASYRQGIHQTPFSRLIRSRRGRTLILSSDRKSYFPVRANDLHQRPRTSVSALDLERLSLPVPPLHAEPRMRTTGRSSSHGDRHGQDATHPPLGTRHKDVSCFSLFTMLNRPKRPENSRGSEEPGKGQKK